MWNNPSPSHPRKPIWENSTFVQLLGGALEGSDEGGGLAERPVRRRRQCRANVGLIRGILPALIYTQQHTLCGRKGETVGKAMEKKKYKIKHNGKRNLSRASGERQPRCLPGTERFICDGFLIPPSVLAG